MRSFFLSYSSEVITGANNFAIKYLSTLFRHLFINPEEKSRLVIRESGEKRSIRLGVVAKAIKSIHASSLIPVLKSEKLRSKFGNMGLWWSVGWTPGGGGGGRQCSATNQNSYSSFRRKRMLHFGALIDDQWSGNWKSREKYVIWSSWEYELSSFGHDTNLW